MLDVRLFAIADKYFIEPLKHLAAEKFAGRCKDEWPTAAFADAVAEVYNTAPENDNALQSIVVNTVKEHDKEIRETSANHQELNTVMRQIPDFGADLFFSGAVKSSRDEDDSVTWYNCPNNCASRRFCVAKGTSPITLVSCRMRCCCDTLEWWDLWRCA